MTRIKGIKNIKFYSVVSVLLFTALFVNSCSKIFKNSPQCSPGEYRFIDTDIFIKGEKNKVNLDFIKEENKSFDYEWSYGRAMVSKQIIADVLSDLGMNHIKNVFYIKLYFPNRDINQGNSLEIDKISGFTLFYLDDGRKAYSAIYNKDLKCLGKDHIDMISSFIGAFTMYDLLKIPDKQGTVIAFNNFESLSGVKSIWNEKTYRIKELAKIAYLKMKRKRNND